jgi:hypothetical protein
MNRTHTDHITLGRNPILTYDIVVAVHNRRVREAQAARRRKNILRITGLPAAWQMCKKHVDAIRYGR